MGKAESPEPLGRVAEEWLERYPEDAITEIDVASLARLLEWVVRETAQLAGEGGVAGALQRWGLDPESREEPDGR